MKNILNITAASLLALTFAAGCSDEVESNEPEPTCETPDCDNEGGDENEGGQGGGNEGGQGGGNEGGQGGQGGEEPAEPSCDDGLQNADETDVDCGGDTCAPCDIGEECEVSADCAVGACDTDFNTCRNVSSCADARAVGAIEDGIYGILRDDNTHVDMYCDMTTDGGGWTLLSVVRDDDGTNEVPIASDQVCTDPSVALACKGMMLPEHVSAEVELRVQDITSGNFVVYGDFSASDDSFLRYLSLEKDLVEDWVTSNIEADPDLSVVSTQGITVELGDAQLRQWIRHGGWYVRADGSNDDVRISTTGYTTHNNTLLEHAVAGGGGVVTDQSHQVLYYR